MFPVNVTPGSKYPALIFDMDGVLVDNHDLHLEAWMMFCRQYDLSITQEDFTTKMFGRTNEDTLGLLFGKDFTPEETAAMSDEKEKIYRQYFAPKMKPLKGLMPFLETASGLGFPLALATSAPPKNARFTLETLHLAGFFSVVVDSSMVAHGKPDPEVYLKAARRLGVSPAHCIVFEDSLPGIQSAKNAGMKVVGIATTLSNDKLNHCDMVVSNFSETDLEQLLLLFR